METWACTSVSKERPEQFSHEEAQTTKNGCFHFEVQDNVGIIRMDRPPSNAIHAEWIQGFTELIPKIEQQREVRCGCTFSESGSAPSSCGDPPG